MPGNIWNEAEQEIFNADESRFDETALRIFHLQYHHNPLYRAYCDTLRKNPGNVTSREEIPFLPIGFFKTHAVKTTDFREEAVFESSGTTGITPSRHFVRNIELYRKSFERSFALHFGDPKDICLLALLPSYLERGHSSLVYMADALIRCSRFPQSGFYLDNHEDLHETLKKNEADGVPTLLLGVTYALLDFSEKYPMPLHHTAVMETGGMKGRRKEMLREEVHAVLKRQFGIPFVHSEYGMTELLSQAYSKKDGIFTCPPWMKILVRHEDDPMDVSRSGSGAVNIIDLANLYSCAFIATDDAGKVNPDGSFEITGRLDNTDMRGCSLMVSANN